MFSQHLILVFWVVVYIKLTVNRRKSLDFPKTNIIETRKAKPDVRYMQAPHFTQCVAEFRQCQRHHCVPEGVS
jgi:hypothetical protein